MTVILISFAFIFPDITAGNPEEGKKTIIIITLTMTTYYTMINNKLLLVFSLKSRNYVLNRFLLLLLIYSIKLFSYTGMHMSEKVVHVQHSWPKCTYKKLPIFKLNRRIIFKKKSSDLALERLRQGWVTMTYYQSELGRKWVVCKKKKLVCHFDNYIM